mmetsp:Transcript_20302/g.34581  ORF Transcript_20302/g.34581 Transcript_20302/m.34581 type:complete len:223 (+) Transcript_20302:70-738(+)
MTTLLDTHHSYSRSARNGQPTTRGSWPVARRRTAVRHLGASATFKDIPPAYERCARRRSQQILALLKSISGCDSMNFLSMSCLLCSSEVGSPADFCRWSYIIFSTVCRVSPSRSDSFEFSGSTFCVLISSSPTTTVLHHSIWFDLVSVSDTSRLPSAALSSTDQKQSSILTAAKSSPPTMGSAPLTCTTSFFLAISTFSCFAFVPAGTATYTCRSPSVCVQR